MAEIAQRWELNLREGCVRRKVERKGGDCKVGDIRRKENWET